MRGVYFLTSRSATDTREGSDVDSLSRFFAFALLALLVAFGIACGASESGDDSETFMMLGGSEGSSFSQSSAEDSAAPPTTTGVQEDDMSEDFDVDEPMEAVDEESGDGLASGYPPVAAQNRLIVRIVDLTIEVDDVSQRINDVSGIAVQRGGWVVSEQRSSQHVGHISIRVPSAQLDSAVRAISDLGLDVLSLISTSDDVTEEYFDVQARIQNLNVTRDALRELLNREGDLEDILEVQREVTRVSGEIEVLEGRKRLLEQTTATSLINVTLELAPGEMSADAGPDLQAVEGRPVAFRATFNEPQGIDSYEYWWEFGDGVESERRTRTALTETPGQRVTEIVWYSYHSSEQSPYFVTFKIRGTGEAGVVDGEDAIKVNVERVPTLFVSTEESVVIRADEELTLTGSFTRPGNVMNLTYEWDFGDGLIPSTGDIGEGVQEISATHEYTIDRSAPYEARFTVEGETDFGAPISSSSTVFVYVEPSAQWVIGFLDIPETARTATQALSVIAQAAVVAVIWIVLLSPVWGLIVALVWFLRRRTSIGLPSRRRRERAPQPDGPEIEQGSDAGGAEAEHDLGDSHRP